MLFVDSRRDVFWADVRAFLKDWNEGTALDICCGYGQFAKVFNQELYTGLDFSDNMRELAVKKNSGYLFESGDARTYAPRRMFDLVFECNSLHSLQMKPDEFIGHYKQFANKAVACLEADEFIIYYVDSKREEKRPRK